MKLFPMDKTGQVVKNSLWTNSNEFIEIKRKIEPQALLKLVCFQ